MSHQEAKDQTSRFFLGNKQSEAYQNVPGYGQPNYGNPVYNPAGRFLIFVCTNCLSLNIQIEF